MVCSYDILSISLLSPYPYRLINLKVIHPLKSNIPKNNCDIKLVLVDFTQIKHYYLINSLL